MHRMAAPVYPNIAWYALTFFIPAAVTILPDHYMMRKTPPCIAAGQRFVFSGRNHRMRKVLLSCAFLLFPFMLNAQSGLTFLAPDTVLVGDSAMFIVQGKSAGDAFLWQWEENCYSCDTVQCYEYSTADTLWRVWADTGHHLVTVIHNGIQFQHWVFVMKYDPDCISNVSTCGNLVANGSFEDYFAMPKCGGGIDSACNWTTAYGKDPSNSVRYMSQTSPDYWHVDFVPLLAHSALWDCRQDFSPPTGDFASEPVLTIPAGQQAYAAFFSYVGNPNLPTGGLEYREFIQQRLKVSLMPGHTYELKFYRSLGEISNHATQFHIAFTTDLPRINAGGNMLLYPTPAEGTTLIFSPITQKNGWTYESVTFTYTGNQPAHYMTIGNLSLNSQTILISVPIDPYVEEHYYSPAPGGERDYTYYLIDEFSLVDQTPPPCCDNELVHIKSNPGTNYSSASQYTTAAGTQYFVEDRLYVDVNTSYSNSTFLMGENAIIEIAGGKKLTFQNCTLRACTVMWDFIDVFGPGTEIEMIDCVVMDAEIAIDARANATVNVTGTQFINNHKGMYIHGYMATAPLNISRNTFTSNGGMLHPREGQRSYMHIQLKDVPHANLAPSTYVQKNVYSYATYGIHCINSELRLGHSDFNMIRDYHNQVGGAWAVYSVNDVNKGMRYLDMADPGSGPNYFVNCDNGVYASLNLRVEITGNEFFWIKNTGIKIGRLYNLVGVPVYGRLMDNYLYTYGNGIEVQSMYESHFLAQNNELLSDGKSLTNSGIYVHKGPGLYARCLDTRKLLLKENKITGYGSGIRSLNASCLAEVDNEIVMGGNALGEFRGIYNTNSIGTYVYRNDITGQGRDWRWSGIRNDIAPSNYVSCNYIENTGNGLYFSGIGYQTIYRNTMKDANNGVLLNYGTTGDVVAYDMPGYNRWEGNMTNHFHADNSDGNLSPYFFDPAYGGQPEYPSTIVSVSNNPLDRVPALIATTVGLYNQAAFCEREFFMTYTGVLTPVLWDGSPDKLEEIVVTLTGEAPEFSIYHAEATRSYRQMAYEILKAYPDMADTNVTLADFRDEMDGTPAEEIYNAQKAIIEGNWSVVASFANPTATDDLYTARLRKVFGYVLPLYMAYDTTGACMQLPLDELDSLLYFAGLCPYEYDKVPTLSRFVLEVMGIPYITNACETVTDPPAPKMQAAQNQDRFMIYPNPATETVNLKLPDTMEKSSTLVTVLDATGKLVYSSGYTTTLEVSGWRSGLYICRVSDGKENHRSTFIVQ